MSESMPPVSLFVLFELSVPPFVLRESWKNVWKIILIASLLVQRKTSSTPSSLLVLSLTIHHILTIYKGQGENIRKCVIQHDIIFFQVSRNTFSHFSKKTKTSCLYNFIDGCYKVKFCYTWRLSLPDNFASNKHHVKTHVDFLPQAVKMLSVNFSV